MKTIRSEYLPNKDFQAKVVAKASSAAEGLCKWVLAMDEYDRAAKVCNISRFEVFTVLLLRVQYFWDVKLCCLLSDDQYSNGSYSIHL
jgi:hypothetical protein